MTTEPPTADSDLEAVLVAVDSTFWPDEAAPPADAQETPTETPLRSFSPDARTAEEVTRVALAAVRSELAQLRTHRDGPLADRIRQLVDDEDRLRRSLAAYQPRRTREATP